MIKIENIALKEMVKDATRTFPDECCGFIFGSEENGLKIITHIMVVDNAKEGDKKRRFEINAFDYMAAERFSDENKLHLLGVYHSHPNHPSLPSETDRLSAQPFFSYIIISINNKQFNSIQSWVLNDDAQFEEENILIEQFSIH